MPGATQIELRLHPGHLGVSADEPPFVTALRIVAAAFGREDEWPEKYGTTYEDATFLMHPYCWCGANDGSCLWCLRGDHPEFDRLLGGRFGAGSGYEYGRHRGRQYYDPPNFWYKPTDTRVRWYKYLGRDMASNRDEIDPDWLARVFAGHPRGLSVRDASDLLAQRDQETKTRFAKMLGGLRAPRP